MQRPPADLPPPADTPDAADERAAILRAMADAYRATRVPRDADYADFLEVNAGVVERLASLDRLQRG